MAENVYECLFLFDPNRYARDPNGVSGAIGTMVEGVNGALGLRYDASTGEQVWTTYQPTTGKRPGLWANAFTIKHEDRYFLANDEGDLVIARLSPQGYDEISRAHLIQPTHDIGNRTVVWSHPAFANRSVYLRNDGEIRCYSLAVD